MRKILFAAACALSVATAMAAWEEKYFAESDHPGTILQIGIDNPVEFPSARYNVYGLRLDLIACVSHDMYGIDVGLAGISTRNSYGVMGTLASVADGNMAGVQLGAFGNIVGGAAYGIQLAGLFNYDRSVGAGVAASFLNISSAYTGVQLGAINVSHNEFNGVQLGVVNVGLVETHGWSLGVVNETARLSGVQIGLINTTTESGKGFQIGVFNGATDFDGFQIGLLNILSNGAIQTLPVFNGSF